LRIALAVVVLVTIAGVVWLFRMTGMPLKSYAGPLPPLNSQESELRDHLAVNVKYLADSIGERSLERTASLEKTAGFIRENLSAGYAVNDVPYEIAGQKVSNLEAILVGTETAQGNVVVGAHYDSVAGTVGANDNASGVAAVLELARLFKTAKPRRTVRFVFFVNEEPPYFQTENMGSAVYARRLRSQGIPVSAMISLETIGFYSDAKGSQKYPPPLGFFYPSRGNFIGFVGNPESRDLVRRSVRKFRETTRFPSEGVSAPAEWPGVGWSDQWSFWQQKYPGIMVTDTAAFRYPYYHTQLDTSDRVDCEKAARVVDGVRQVVEMLANEP
jgi:Zn-dependent M28 family amino/carboxypeptidase